MLIGKTVANKASALSLPQAISARTLRPRRTTRVRRNLDNDKRVPDERLCK